MAHAMTARINLVAVQAKPTLADYRDHAAFHGKAASLMAAVAREADLRHPTLVSFPELIGMYLAFVPHYWDDLAGETNLEMAATKIVMKNITAVPEEHRTSPEAAARHLLFLQHAVETEAAYVATFSSLAREFGVYLAAGSIALPPVDHEPSKGGAHVADAAHIYNTAYLFSPRGVCLNRVQKVNLVPGFEERVFDPAPPTGLVPADTAIGRIGTLVCFDGFHETLVERYWHVDAPGWALRISRQVEKAHGGVLSWGPHPRPYEGDPYSYLRAAREPRGFYDAHEREPVFVFATKGILLATGGRDIAVNFASAGFSTLGVVATYYLGAATFSPLVGFGAAGVLAIERYLLAASVEGWRDDAFASLLGFFACAVVHLARRPTPARGLLAGLIGGLACLTRVTSLSFVLPAHACLLLRERGRRQALLSLGFTLLLLAPYLLSCAIAFDDPFRSINIHTGYYRAKQGLDHRPPMAWTDYLLATRRPFHLLDTMLVGLTHYPLSKKWLYFSEVSPLLGRASAAAAVLGLLLFLRNGRGRFLLLLLFTSLFPYAFTWDVPGGSASRFTLHAYPFYLIAAWVTLTTVARALCPQRFREVIGALRWRPVVLWMIGVTGAALVGWVGAGGLLYLRVAEAIQAGDPVQINPSSRDLFFFGRGWRWPRTVDGAPARSMRGTEAALGLPLAAGRDYLLTLRLAPPEGAASPHGTRLFLNGSALVETRDEAGTPDTHGYAVRLPAARAREGRNCLEIRSAPGTLLRSFHIAPSTRTTAS